MALRAHGKRGGCLLFLSIFLVLQICNLPPAYAGDKDPRVNPKQERDIQERSLVESPGSVDGWDEAQLVMDIDDPNRVFIPLVMCRAESPPQNVQITGIFFDGLVPQSESDEYAEVTNHGSGPVNLIDWRLNAGSPGQDFNFPNFVIDPGQTCRVYTNEIHPETCGFSFESGVALWLNSGDCGYLIKQAGDLVSSYCYSDG